MLCLVACFLTSPFQPPPPSGILVSASYGGELRLLAEFFWVVDPSPSMSIGCFVFLVKSPGVSFFWIRPFGYGDTAFCILEVLDCCGGLVDFILEGEGF